MRMAQAMGVASTRLRPGFHAGLLHAGLGGAHLVPQQGPVRAWASTPLILAFVVVVIGGLGSLEGALVGALMVGVVRELASPSFRRSELGDPLPDGGRGSAHPARRAVRSRMSPLGMANGRLLVTAGFVALVLAILPWVVEPYQTVLLSYGLVFAIAALGFNLLLGYTGLLSFGHSAYFGVGAYAAALPSISEGHSMRPAPGRHLASALVAAVFGVVCVRYTRIFFGIRRSPCPRVCGASPSSSFWVTGVPTAASAHAHAARRSIGAGQTRWRFWRTGTTTTSSCSSCRLSR